jgi:hypothetical protein
MDSETIYIFSYILFQQFIHLLWKQKPHSEINLAQAFLFTSGFLSSGNFICSVCHGRLTRQLIAAVSLVTSTVKSYFNHVE